MAKANQNAIYTMLMARYSKSLKISSPVGGTPVRRMPMPATKPPKASVIRISTKSLARNLPLITSSLYMGCAKSLVKDPLFYSPLMASKPIEIPTKGPNSERNHVKDGREVPAVVNRRIKIKFAAESSVAALIFEAAE